MSHRIVVALIVVFGVSCTLTGLVLLALSWSAPVPDSWGFRGFTVLFATGFGGAGANLTFRRPHNRVGWVLLAAGTLSALQVALEEYSIYGGVARATPLPGAVFAGWAQSWIWLVGVVLIVNFTLLLFPTGSFVSPRWRIAGWLAGLNGLVGVLCLAFAAGPLNNAPYFDNPYPLLGEVGHPLWFASFFGVMFLAVASAASLFARYRRATAAERQQLKWLAFDAGFIAVAVVITAVAQVVAPENKAYQVIFILSIAVMPFTIGIAVLRYRLYDIDVIINRALVYGATTAAIGVAFVAGIVVLQSALRPVTGGSEVAVAASTLLCFALFQPIRRSMQAAVDRRFYRARYDAARAVDAFSVRLRDEVALDAVRGDLLDAVGQTVQPASASLWLRDRGAFARNDSRTPAG
jgi:hypothetical protein